MCSNDKHIGDSAHVKTIISFQILDIIFMSADSQVISNAILRHGEGFGHSL